MIYRDKISIDSGPAVRANVWVLSTATRYASGSTMAVTAITAALPPSRATALSTANKITWQGKEYLVQGESVPIMALGRLDHWEITAQRGAAA